MPAEHDPDSTATTLYTVAFEVTFERHAGRPVVLDNLAEQVETTLRQWFPDEMIRRLDPCEVLDTEVWR